jgi:hypothetical protein
MRVLGWMERHMTYVLVLHSTAMVGLLMLLVFIAI